MAPSIHHLSSTFFSLFILLLLHLGCFTFSSHRNHRHRHNRANSLRKKLAATKTTVFSFIRRFSASKPASPKPPPPPSIPSPSSSTRSLRLINPPIITPVTTHPLQDNYPPLLCRSDIHPCNVCGEIFQTLTLLENHQSTKHAVSELLDGENIIRIIFKAGWPDEAKTPTIQRILKIHNSPKILNRFEEYRESVKSIAEGDQMKTLSDERCAADGNEVLRFYCTTFVCELDSSICSQRYCSLCGIIRCGFSRKMDGISMLPTSYRAHLAIPEDMEEEFGFMHVKRALLVCRVIAGRVGCGPDLAGKGGHGFDSLVGRDDREDELLVFNPRAVLPCFVIAYTM